MDAAVTSLHLSCRARNASGNEKILSRALHPRCVPQKQKIPQHHGLRQALRVEGPFLPKPHLDGGENMGNRSGSRLLTPEKSGT